MVALHIPGGMRQFQLRYPSITLRVSFEAWKAFQQRLVRQQGSSSSLETDNESDHGKEELEDDE